jgi:XTP/dITP diphosphohydrolase
MGIFADLEGVTLVGADDVGGIPDVVEDGETFEHNARKKAREVARAKGMPTLADDSGLEVDALGGAPGVYSARYAGEGASDADNNEKLLRALADVPPERRTARFRCALAFADPEGHLGGDELVAYGAVEGVIGATPRGEEGFGYDRLFFALGRDETMAEIDPALKNRMSHRARAAEAMRELLRGYLAVRRS